MNWLLIKVFCLSLVCTTGLTARAASPALRTDSLIRVEVNDSMVVTLPDSLIRQLAIGLGMRDSVSTDSLQRCHDTRHNSIYERRRRKRLEGWMNLIPNQATLQFAGSIGLLNAGLGWHYGRGDHWETELLIGFVPRYHSERTKATFTLKQRYVPWHCQLNSRWTIQPLTTGIGFNTISGDDFWKNLPDRYPHQYYGFSTKVRIHLFLGQRLRYAIPYRHRLLNQAVSLYYELSTCDLYLISKITNRHFPWKETLSLAFGLRWEM